MSAVAEVLSTVAPNRAPRCSELPTCPVCADSMVAAEGSAYLSEHLISYLWTCDNCGYGFVTKHSVKQRFLCN
jgi:C4-type Zn-finger protein